ncbi:unnamed protein product [Rotaria socialis]|uniref:Uncharacterized protein n=1 Tax=Rotaria socialis TaxID=392032 RepID=A0A818MQL4_9BILA|nr:unnamed protein product [Rotaria socialis]
MCDKNDKINKSSKIQQTNTRAKSTLATTNEQSTIPKPSQTSGIESRQIGGDTDDVICTNHFPCSFADNLTFYQYDVIIEEYHEKQGKYVNITSREKRRRFVSDILLAKIIHPTAVCWYDEGFCMYSTTNFEDQLPLMHENEEHGYRRRLTINSLCATSGTDELNQFSTRVIETLIKQVLKEQFKAIDSIFYPWDGEIDQDGPHDLLTGFRLAMCRTESGPTLNVDTTITRFYPHLDLLPFIWERLLLKNKSSFQGWLSDEQYNIISLHLKDVEITTAQSEHEKKYILTGDFSNDLPAKIHIRDEENLLSYYKHLGFELCYPKLYCLKAYPLGNPTKIVDLPIEYCSLREWQPVKENEFMKPVTAPVVHKRYHSILAAIQNCNFHDDELSKEIQLEVRCDKMMEIPYEILTKPQITLSRHRGFTDPVPIDNMAFLYLTDRREPNARQMQEKLLNNFYDAADRQRMALPENLDEYEIFVDRNLESTLRNRLSRLKNNQCQFILCLSNCRNQEIHRIFKQIASIEFGLVTQCANFSKVKNMHNVRTYCDNLLKSVNIKLSGENKRIAQLETPIKTMFIGADVQHAKNNYKGEIPSIAAVVASMNSECTVTNQRVSRQWPKEGKQSEETILLLKNMVEELLIAFKTSNDGTLPEHIVFFRDGVDDGQFERIHNGEVVDLKKAFQAVYPASSSPPLLTFIVVKKRHNTRLFRLLPSNEVINVESGVVVDECIVNANPNYPNFFLNSHEPRLGTNKIGNYVVIVNEIEYLFSDLEELTYSLCHTDQRIDNRMSESIPSVVHLADAAASRARQLFFNQPRSPTQIQAEMLRVHEDMQDVPNMF